MYLSSKGRNRDLIEESDGFHTFDETKYQSTQLTGREKPRDDQYPSAPELSPKQFFSAISSSSKLDVPSTFLQLPFLGLGSFTSIPSSIYFDDSRSTSESKSRCTDLINTISCLEH